MAKKKVKFGNPAKQSQLNMMNEKRKESLKYRHAALSIIEDWLQHYLPSLSQNKVPPHVNLMLTMRACISAGLYVEGGYECLSNFARKIASGDMRELSVALDSSDRKEKISQAGKLIISLHRLAAYNDTLKSGFLAKTPSKSSYQLLGIKVTQ